jgi:hypothetical protein
MYKTLVAVIGDLSELAPDGAAVLARVGSDDGTPFVLGADGSYDLELNRFFRELGSWGARSTHTREAYARELMLFGRFLHQHRGGRTIWQADQEDLRAFKRARRRTKGVEVTASTWNRFIAALDKWAAWALHENLLDRRPFRMIEKTVLTPGGMVTVLHNAEREIDEDSTEVRSCPMTIICCGGTSACAASCPAAHPIRHGVADTASATPCSPTCWYARGCG